MCHFEVGHRIVEPAEDRLCLGLDEESNGNITAQPDRRKLFYVLAAKGMDLIPVLTEMALRGAAHEDTPNQARVRLIKIEQSAIPRGRPQALAFAGRRGEGETEECLV